MWLRLLILEYLAEMIAVAEAEVCGVAASFLCRAGIDRVDLEVIYTSELERGYSAVKGASLAFGKKFFGVDMAMVWYGGNQHDEL